MESNRGIMNAKEINPTKQNANLAAVCSSHALSKYLEQHEVNVVGNCG